MPGTYKVSTNTSSLGTSAKFGAADINRITQTLNGDADIDSPDINSPLTLHSSKLFINNPGNTFAYTIIASSILGNRDLLIPLLTASDTLAVLSLAQTFSNKTLDSTCIVDSASLPAAAVTLTGSQTLTNKTITQPIISTISNTGIVTLPTATDTLVGRDTTDILTNKTLTLPIISAVSNSGTITFPTGTLTLASSSGTENLTNKTLDSTNTISSATSLPTVTIAKGGTGATSAAAGFDALSAMTTAGDTQYGGASGTRTRLAIGTANQLLRTNSGATAPEWASTLSGLTLTSPALNTPTVTGSGGTLTLPAGPDTLVGLTTAGTLTNKTLTAPIISTISNTGTVTLPTATDTLVGKATTDTLTNKTIDPMANTLQNIVIHPGIKKTGSWMASAAPNASATACSGILNMTWTIINVGTNTFTGVNKNAISGINGGCAYKWSNGGAGASQAGFRSNPSPATYVERDYNPRIDFKLKLGQTTAERVGLGFIGSTGAPLAGVEPAGSLPAVMFWLDTSVDANWHILQNLNSATSDKTTIANVAAADTNAHVFSIRAVNASTKWQYYYGAATDGPPTESSTWVDINTTIPAATSGLNIYFWTENIGATTPFFDWYWIGYVQDV